MRTCEYGDCTFPVFGTDKNTGIGYCRSHQGQRTDKKPNKLQYHVIKCKGESLATKYGKALGFGFESQIDLFNWLWDEAKDRNGIVTCPYTKERLNRFYNTEMWLNCFAHVLCKKNWTYFRLNPKNIKVVFPEFHRIVDQGTSIDRANHPGWDFEAWDRRKEELKLEYQLFKKQNLLR